ncbi:MAG: hypothetical protein ACRCSC_08735 [Lactococcus garvieae]
MTAVLKKLKEINDLLKPYLVAVTKLNRLWKRHSIMSKAIQSLPRRT